MYFHQRGARFVGDIYYLVAASPDDVHKLPTPDNDTKTGEVVQVDFGRSVANDQEPTIFNSLQVLLRTFSIDFQQIGVQQDFQIIKHLVQGMMDRSDGGTKSSSSACLMLDALRLTMGYGEEVKDDDTDELFGDLLNQID